MKTWVTGKLDKFVVVHNGLVYYFKMKGQYLFRVSTEENFYEENENATSDRVRYVPMSGSIVPLKMLMAKRKFFAEHPVNKEGLLRQGVELLIEYKIKK